MSDILGRHTNECPMCDGAGHIITLEGRAETCPRCHGRGYIVEDFDEPSACPPL